MQFKIIFSRFSIKPTPSFEGRFSKLLDFISTKNLGKAQVLHAAHPENSRKKGIALAKLYDIGAESSNSLIWHADPVLEINSTYQYLLQRVAEETLDTLFIVADTVVCHSLIDKVAEMHQCKLPSRYDGLSVDDFVVLAVGDTLANPSDYIKIV